MPEHKPDNARLRSELDDRSAQINALGMQLDELKALVRRLAEKEGVAR